jgi:hypothetical protein
MRSQKPTLNLASAFISFQRFGSQLRQERNLCSHPRHPIPQPRRGGIFIENNFIPPDNPETNPV